MYGDGSRFVHISEHHKVYQHEGDRFRYTLHAAKRDDCLMQVVMPEGWKPSPIMASRIVDTMMAAVEGRDLDRVPVGEVFGLVTTVAADIIRQGAQLKAQLTKAQVELAEAQQKHAADAKESMLVADALMRCLMLEAVARVEREKLVACDPLEYVVALVRNVIDMMAIKPKDVASLVKEIREVGKLWQQK